MKCRYCNVELAPLRSLTDGEFCCDDHRRAFEGSVSSGARHIDQSESRKPVQAGSPAVSESGPAPATTHNFSSAFDFQASNTPVSKGTLGLDDAGTRESIVVEGASQPGFAPGPEASRPEPLFSAQPAYTAPAAHVSDDGDAVSEESANSGADLTSHPSQEVLGSWQWINAAWSKAPRDLKILLTLLPVLLGLAIGPSMPRVKVNVSSKTADNVQNIVVTQWRGLQQNISNRAAVAFEDDFRSGLDAWQSRSNLTRSWSYDASGFVRPGPLAIYKPTEDLSDYRFEFLEEIDQKALGCAFRAADLDNYYAVKLVVVRPGPLPLVHLVRYPVIKGKEGRHLEKPLPFTTRPDTVYRVMVDVRGSDFTIMVQGQVVDFWSDNHLHEGGVGFFCGRGERARLRWVEVSHQYDALGRLCAYLAPYGIDGKNGDLN